MLRQPWKAKHLNVEVDTGRSESTVAQVEIANEHGMQKYDWSVSWVKVGETGDFLPEAGTAYKYGQSQVRAACDIISDSLPCCYTHC